MTGRRPVCADFVAEGDDRRAEGPFTRVDGANILRSTGRRPVSANFVREGDDRRAKGPFTRVDGANISSPKATCVLRVLSQAWT